MNIGISKTDLSFVSASFYKEESNTFLNTVSFQDFVKYFSSRKEKEKGDQIQRQIKNWVDGKHFQLLSRNVKG